MKFTTHFELHSQTTRLFERRYHIERGHPIKYGILTLYDVLFQGTYTWAAPENIFSKLQFGHLRQPDFKFELFPLHSPLLGESC